MTNETVASPIQDYITIAPANPSNIPIIYSDNQLAAIRLFELFTANIIKEDVIFSR